MASFTAAGERRCAQTVADDAEAGTIARYQRAREVAQGRGPHPPEAGRAPGPLAVLQGLEGVDGDDALGGAVGDQLGHLGERADLGHLVEKQEQWRIHPAAAGDGVTGLLAGGLVDGGDQGGDECGGVAA